MDNHFHILLSVPDRERWLRRFAGEDGEENLLAHLGTLYSKAFLRQLRGEISKLREQGREKEVVVMLDRFKKRFCDLSLFVKELKERFSRWFNAQHGRRGTLWMDRFKSVIVENGQALQAMAAYIDLNPVRAGLVDDPALSEWTGYGEAVNGSRRTQRGLCRVMGVPQGAWEGRGEKMYRCWLYHDGVSVAERDSQTGKQRPLKKRGFTIPQMARVKDEQGGALSDGELLRKRISSFSTGVVIGSENYVKGVSEFYQQRLKRQRIKEGSRLDIGRALSGKETSIFTMRK